MENINISVNVHGMRPPWALADVPIKEDYYLYSDVRYRLYINNQLITERTWIWSNDTYLRENVWVTGGEESYEIRLEPVTFRQQQASFKLSDLSVAECEFKTILSEDTVIKIDSINTINHENN